jgi:Cys-rich protein (TIGR01571 family)
VGLVGAGGTPGGAQLVQPTQFAMPQQSAAEAKAVNGGAMPMMSASMPTAQAMPAHGHVIHAVAVQQNPGGGPRGMDGICDCGSDCDAQTFWVPCCCPCISFGTIADTHKLVDSWLGASFGTNAIVYGFLWFVYMNSRSLGDGQKDKNPSLLKQMGASDALAFWVNLGTFVALGLLMAQLRSKYTKKHRIEGVGDGCHNCCLSTFCGGCVLCQIMRHSKRFTGAGGGLPQQHIAYGGQQQQPVYAAHGGQQQPVYATVPQQPGQQYMQATATPVQASATPVLQVQPQAVQMATTTVTTNAQFNARIQA